MEIIFSVKILLSSIWFFNLIDVTLVNEIFSSPYFEPKQYSHIAGHMTILHIYHNLVSMYYCILNSETTAQIVISF